MSDLLPIERARLATQESDTPDEKVAASTVEGVVLDFLDRMSKGQDVQLTDMASDPMFRGLHFRRIEQAAKALEDKGVVGFDGVRVTKMAARIRTTWKQAAGRLTLDDIYELDVNGDLDDDDAEELLRFINRTRDPEKALRKADKMLRTHGVESLDPDSEDFLSDPYASYLNTGDLYNVTLAWVYPKSRWEITTVGDLRREMSRGKYATSHLPPNAEKHLEEIKRIWDDFDPDLDRELKKRGFSPKVIRHIKKLWMKGYTAKDMVWWLESRSRLASDKEAASGLYGFTKKTQRDVEATIRKVQRKAKKIAKRIYGKDQKVSRFIQVHAQRTGSVTAKLIMEAMKDLGPKFASEAPVNKTAGYGLYGFNRKTAGLGLSACTDLRDYVGAVAYDLHSRRQARYDRITGFLTKHSKKGKCAYSKLLLASYPDQEQFKMAQEEQAALQAQEKKASTPSSVDEWLAWDEGSSKTAMRQSEVEDEIMKLLIGDTRVIKGPSNKTYTHFARYFGVDAKVIKRALDSLVRQGRLEKTRRGWKRVESEGSGYRRRA